MEVETILTLTQQDLSQNKVLASISGNWAFLWMRLRIVAEDGHTWCQKNAARGVLCEQDRGSNRKLKG